MGSFPRTYVDVDVDVDVDDLTAPFRRDVYVIGKYLYVISISPYVICLICSLIGTVKWDNFGVIFEGDSFEFVLQEKSKMQNNHSDEKMK